MRQTIHEAIEQLHGALKDYIEATYHISDPALIVQRAALLDRASVIHQIPYLESTPKYQTDKLFGEIEGLPPEVTILFETLAQPSSSGQRLLYDPPYKHQSEALQYSLIDGKNLVIMTGTGSGKTESFLMPIMGRLAREASASPKSFLAHNAMRAMVLYPMNALVNDQLGRLRALFGDERVVKQFGQWAGRPPRFARYTSRTPYAGVRTSQSDSRKLKAFDDFYVEIERQARSDSLDIRKPALELKQALKDRGKWPAKPDLVEWYGEKNKLWINPKTGKYQRAVCLPNDSELLTRQEVQDAPPDLLVTNYSMLEYMLMRPIERTIFDSTRDWLKANPGESFLVVLDEAHLYRGAPGAEVGLLLRRLRDRIEAPIDRFKVICATASFKDHTYAPSFGSQLSGLPEGTFVPVRGALDLKTYSATADVPDAECLASIDLQSFYDSATDVEKVAIAAPLLARRKIAEKASIELALFEALKDYEPLGLLINSTMQKALPIEGLGKLIFPDVQEDVSSKAITTLLAFGSIARPEPKSAGLLPCRIHNFFRGLPGLWVCMDPNCTVLDESEKSGICGTMFSQPHEKCGCGARVLEFYTCRNCGTAYARAYTDDVDQPVVLWKDPGDRLRAADGDAGSLLPIDLLLEPAKDEQVAEPAEYDLETGMLNAVSSERVRTVYLRSARVTDAADDDDDGDDAANLESRGQFCPCGVCGKASRGRSYVQDHQTKGDEPFQALVARQIEIQPPSPNNASAFAPLRGRKVLAFSDSRQVAARLAPNLQMYSTRDSLRPLIAWGMERLSQVPALRSSLCLEDLYFSVLLASKKLGVRLRPELKGYESFGAELAVENAIENGDADTDAGLLSLCFELRSERPPEALLENIVATINDKFRGFESLAIASIVEKSKHTSELQKLPEIPGLPNTPEAKVALARAWFRCWQSYGFLLNTMPPVWWRRPRKEGVSVRGFKGKKLKAFEKVLKDKAAQKVFNEKWLPKLFDTFAPEKNDGYKGLKGIELSLQFGGEWHHCAICKSVHRIIPGIAHCIDCGEDAVEPLDVNENSVFLARKGFYRKPVVAALGVPPRQPFALIAAEHTAQLNAPQNDDVFSKAEENELLFQDVALPSVGGKLRVTAIDVLSSTTTMEVGIDLGALSGVALRNMPPGRANYQQRAGRAGRRANAVATVVAFGSADSHDEHYFSNPEGMISGDVIDPRLTLDNKDIVCRHIRAFLLQSYHQDRIKSVDPNQPHDLFSVLGTVSDFRNGKYPIGRADLEVWIAANEDALRKRLDAWIPSQLSTEDRAALLASFKSDCLAAIDDAIAIELSDSSSDESEEDESEDAPEEGDERPRYASNQAKLLDRLLYCGKLPRYAFPTDVATFHIFDEGRSTKRRPIMRFAPSQGLPIALSQYAPGKQVWVSGKCYTSNAIYSVSDERFDAWENKRIYMECRDCGYANTFASHEAQRGDVKDCIACGGSNTFGAGRYWLRPPGFAHPIDVSEVTSPDDVPETSYATRAKLTMDTPKESEGWIAVNDRVRILPERRHLLVSNTGPGREGYTYCTKCGRIEADKDPDSKLIGPHRVPFPTDEDKRICDGISPTRHIVLGTDFISDIALFSLRVAKPIQLRPAHTATMVALRTVSEALASTASQILGIEPGELMAEYRPAITPAGVSGLEAEIFLYDTLPGGAGFAPQVANRGLELLEHALQLVKGCPEGCDSSCYRCLRSFKNKFEHSLLDRHVGTELLEYLLLGELPKFDAQRIAESTQILCKDLQRQHGQDVSFKLNHKIKTDVGEVTAPILVSMPKGKQAIVALSGPLTSDHPDDPVIRALRDSGSDIPVVTENELVIRLNLPHATRSVRQKLVLP
ncbi:MAG: DEAD/DEAH box helicase [Hyphomonas sp.]|uniref:DEAD/DEAH box helicase n=1 Tax=Hyphomonas sp. TaxID=87 RepID=UPI001D970728|nr:DEAD/DEAH box helicase [Hyphomonas sp.]MBA4226228.1 DEAD/DEAH box helicase [Hyphomonas sp.]